MLIKQKSKLSWQMLLHLIALIIFSGVASAVTPNPMTWETPPYANGAFIISMKATTASDPSGVEYYFTCTSGGGHDSGWQDSPLYEDRILKPDTTYTYTVKARDKSASPTETAASIAKSATTHYSEFAGPVVGYIPGYRPISSSLDYQSLTHINLMALGADASGNLLDYTNHSELPVYVTNAHANNVKVYVTIVGSYNDLVQNPTPFANFISQLTQFCLDNDFDGVDIDWEEPYGLSSQGRENYSLLVQALDEALSPYDLGLTIAGSMWYYDINPWALKHLDWINVMAYDMGKPDHSTFQDALDALAFWEDYGVSRHKLVLGVPFYGYGTDGNQYTYAQIYDWYQPGPDVDSIDGYYFNGIDTIKQKTDYAFTNSYGGMMIWEVGQDKLNHPASLLAPLSETAKQYGVPDPSMPSKQVAYWSMDETTGTTAQDGSGNGLDGIVTNTSFDIASVPGAFGTAMQFDGTDDHIAVLNTPLLNPRNAITVSAWIKADTWQTDSWNGSIVSKAEWSGDSGGYVLRCGGNGRLSFALAVNGWPEALTDSVMSTGTWYHVAGTYDGSSIRVYINGSEVASTPQSGSIALSTSPLNIGRGAYANSRTFDGAIDEVRIYNYALDSKGIQTLFQGGHAEHPHPYDGQTDVLEKASLQWVSPDIAVRHDVYLGTNQTAVELADRYSPEYKGDVQESIYYLPLMDQTEYFWRIDEVFADESVVTGTVWHFTTDFSCLRGHWEMEETSGAVADDASGCMNDGSVTNTTYDIASVPGKIGKALQFDGFDDYINVPDNSCLNPTEELTVSAWIRADTWQANHWQGGIVSKWDGDMEGYTLSCGDDGRLSFALAIDSTWAEAITDPIMSTGSWYHVAGVYDGSTIKVYINGFESASTGKTGFFDPGANSLNIGRSYNNTRIFDGAIDDVRIYSRALNKTEITDLWHQSLLLFKMDPLNKPGIFAGLAYNGSLSGDIINIEDTYLAFSKISGPAWLTVGADGGLSGTPTLDDLGLNSFTVRVVNDSSGYFDNTILNITVGVPGDFDFDGDVDLSDLNTFAAEYLNAVTYTESAGHVVMEAEHFTTNTPGSGSMAGSDWVPFDENESSDGFMQALPDQSRSIDVQIDQKSPQLRYRIDFETAGEYYIWVKAKAADIASDSIHYGLDGVCASSGASSALRVLRDGSFNWISQKGSGERPKITVETAGVHNFDLWMREDGATLDRVLLTTDVNYDPTISGEPAESALTDLIADLNNDGTVDLLDFSILARHWLYSQEI
ncbi:Chitinase A1 precursor [Anaerohalosphaera lusitana]|uniref:chitinase n=1 Tax=Anaerohalosphaera lusitana TaxID=1936003 RepID=A0A1U9NLP4_9BACT|nr:LamG-like jellyroll fold domain-containing protein [Anaerohalosphaera lusitana]AQT68755.1 Chitinase A1 precursor [Anaerohalosphaera lusitana]